MKLHISPKYTMNEIDTELCYIFKTLLYVCTLRGFFVSTLKALSIPHEDP